MQKTSTFLMFVGDNCGKAQEAMQFYTSLFENSSIESVEYYKEGEFGGKEGLVKLATFTLAGMQYMALDSAIDHKFTFTPAISIFTQCESEEELNRLFNKFSEGGFVMMEVGSYGFSKKFGWVQDRFGISWQLNLQ